MRSTSPAFSPFDVERWVDMSIRFELLDEHAKDNAQLTVSSAEDMSQIEQLTDGAEKMSAKFATLEPNSWVLDGTYKIMPDDVADIQTGWWSDVLSGEHGTFETPPSLTAYFDGEAVDTAGFTLFFDATADSYPDSIRVTTYAADQTTIVEQATFPNSRHTCVIDFPVQGYYAVTFEFLSTSKPRRRVRLCEVLFGVVQIFNNDNIENATIIYAADHIAEAFPSRQLEFTFDNIDRKYNLINPDGLYAYLQQGQDLKVNAVINGEAVDMGTFEFTTAEALDDDITGRIIGNDYVLLALDDATYEGGRSAYTTLAASVAEVLDGLDIPVSLAYPSSTVGLMIPNGTTKREAIRLLAQAACCSVWVDRDGVLHIEPLEVGEPVDELNEDNMPSMGGISVSEPVDRIELVVQDEFFTDINGNPAPTGATYTSGVGKRVKNVQNPCVYPYNGQTVADWLLAQCNRRIRYTKENRCNPAVEIADTLKIYDAYGENRDAVVNEISITFSGDGLTAVTKAIGP